MESTESGTGLATFIADATNGTVEELQKKLISRFEHMKTNQELYDLVNAIELEVTNSLDKTTVLVATAGALSRLYDTGGPRDCLDLAVGLILPLFDATKPPSWLSCRLALDLIKRYQLDGNLQQLNLAIMICELGVESEYANSFLSNLGPAIYLRYLDPEWDEADDLDGAIEILETLRDAPGESEADRARHEMNLASALLSRYERDRDEASLNLAIVASQSCIQHTPNTSRLRPARLDALAGVLITRFKLLGDKPDIDGAIASIDEALGLKTGSISTQRKCLNNIALALRLRFELTGRDSDLDRAILTSDSAMTDLPKNSPDRFLYLNTIASCLRLKYERTGDTTFLQLAISTLEPIFPAAKKHPNQSEFRITLANCLSRLFDHTESIDQLNRAIEHLQDLDCVQHDPDYHNALASALLKRFEKQPSIEDINNAVKSASIAVDHGSTIPSADHSIYLNTYSTALQARRHDNDAKQAVKVSEQAVKLTLKSHPHWGTFQFNLARAFRHLSEQEEDLNLRKAIDAYEELVRSDSAAPALRIMAAIEAVNLFAVVYPSGAYEMLQIALEQLAKASQRTLKRIDQQYTLSKFSGLACTAAAAALEAKESVFEAIRLLELGRGVMMGYRLDTRTEIDALEEKDPLLAVEFKQLRDEIDSHPIEISQITTNYTSKGLALAKAIKRDVLSKDFDSLIDKIRALSGFENFLRGPSLEELKDLTGSGPIVFLNVAIQRCDALILHHGEPTFLSLPTTSTEVEEKTKIMQTLLYDLNEETYLQAGQQLRAILVWLWDTIAGPVLGSLGFKGSRKANATLPRIWWIPCGFLSFLPIHAAGDHKNRSIKNVLDCAVSSYTPTARLLKHARERAKNSANNSDVLFVAMPETPDKVSFPSLGDEISAVRKALPFVHVLQTPTKLIALSFLKSANICFLGCHGEWEERDPSKSRLLLQDWREDPLTVSDVIDLNLEHGQFAFLSACQSAGNPNLDLLDESIHLTAAFQVAGFSHVVGSLWKVRDSHAPTIVEAVVDSMTRNGNGEISFDKVAAELRKKMRILRDMTRRIPDVPGEFPPNPLIWAPYIHMGA